MRKFNLTNSRDNIKRVDVKITYRLTLDNLANAMMSEIAYMGIEIEGNDYDISDIEEIVTFELSPTYISLYIKGALKGRGMNAVVADNDSEELFEWCKQQIQKIVEE